MTSGSRKVSQYDAILKGKIDCPTCGKTMTLRNLLQACLRGEEGPTSGAARGEGEGGGH